MALLAVALYFYNRLEDVPRSVPPLYVMLLGLLLAGPRLIYRMWKDQGIALVVGRRTLVVGAGRAAELLVRESRDTLAEMLRDVVGKAVAQELAARRRREP